MVRVRNDRSSFYFHRESRTLQKPGLLRLARALKDDIVILRKCPFKSITTDKGANYIVNFRDIMGG